MRKTLCSGRAAGKLAHRVLLPWKGALVGVPAFRRVHAQASTTSTEEFTFVTDKPGNTDQVVYGGSSGDNGSQSLRRRPVNYAPETKFTVDNVAAADAARFNLHPSVAYWSEMGTAFAAFNGPLSGEQRVQQLEDVPATVGQLLASSLATGDMESAAYWAYHLSRTAFFLGAAVTGAVTHHLAYQAQSLLNGLGLRSSSSNSSSTGGSSEKPKTLLENVSANARAEVLNRVQEALAVYRRDLQYIKEGQYKLPWDMTDFPAHKQYNPLYVARMTAEFASEAVSTLNRRLAKASADNWFSSNMYPKYYADNTFHYQTDGWLSSRSADVYEFSTETLFFGRQDAMQRTSLLPLVEHIRSRGLDPASLKVAEVGCGTGRFHTFIKDNFPRMSTIASDLSPFYLAKARDNVNYWKSQQAAGLDLGGRDGSGTEYIQGPMESLPLPDASLDAVLCIYCFHEMPESARIAAAQEWFRVLKPGGLVVLTDSVQLGDRPAWDSTLGMFGNMNEPHYRNYIACDMGSLFEAAGFRCTTKYMCSATKTLSLVKPETDNNNQAGSFNSDDVAQQLQQPMLEGVSSEGAAHLN